MSDQVVPIKCILDSYNKIKFQPYNVQPLLKPLRITKDTYIRYYTHIKDINRRIRKLNRNVDNKHVIHKKVSHLSIETYTILNTIEYEGISQFYQIIIVDDNIYVEYEYIEGITLEEYIFNNRLSNKTWSRVVESILTILNKIHSFNIIHYNLKPCNIIIRPDNKITLVNIDCFNEFKNKLKHKIKNKQSKVTDFIYTSPNVLTLVNYDTESIELFKSNDLWAVGIISHMLACDEPLYHSLHQIIQSEPIVFTPIHETQTKIITSLLCWNWWYRPSASEMLKIYFPKITINPLIYPVSLTHTVTVMNTFYRIFCFFMGRFT